MSVDIGQASLKAVVVVSEPFMVEAEEVQDGGVEIVNSGDVFFGLPSEDIGSTMSMAFSNPSPGKPSGEAFGVVVSPAGSFLESRHTAKFSAPHHKSIF